jgi:hypothetical protein
MKLGKSDSIPHKFIFPKKEVVLRASVLPSLKNFWKEIAFIYYNLVLTHLL